MKHVLQSEKKYNDQNYGENPKWHIDIYDDETGEVYTTIVTENDYDGR